MWENQLLDELKARLEGVQLMMDRNDKWRWKGEAHGRYSVKSAYEIIVYHEEANLEQSFFKKFWDTKALPKILFHGT